MENSKVSIQNMDLYYGDFHALKNLNLEIPANQVTAFIGPSGCGKSTCIKSLNRMNDLIDGCKITGTIKIDGEDIYDPRTDVTLLRKRAGMVFQKANPFPMSVYDNIAYGPRVHGIKNRAKLDEIVENSLRGAALWDEVKDRLKKSALGLSGGQQQRLCIARDVELARQVCGMDDQVDAMFSKIVLEVCGTITENPQSVMKEVDLMFITKYIERMGDHATNIAEWVVYMETGVHPDLNDGRI